MKHNITSLIILIICGCQPAEKEALLVNVEKCAACDEYPENCPPEHTCNYRFGNKCIWDCCEKRCGGDGKCNVTCSSCGDKHVNDHVKTPLNCVACKCGASIPTEHTGNPTCVDPCSGCKKYDYTNHGDIVPTPEKSCSKCGTSRT